MSDIKKKLLKYCEEYVDKRIRAIEEVIEEARNAANGEVKSSAGDKHETARAMAQLEQEKNAGQLEEALKLRRSILEVKKVVSTDTVGFGSLVYTNKGIYYIALSVGAVKLQEIAYYVISPVAPIAKAFEGKRVGDEVTFNGNTFKIQKIY